MHRSLTTAYAQGNIAAVNTWSPTGLLARNSALNTVAQRLDAHGSVRSADTFDAYGRCLAEGDNTDPYGYRGQVGYYTDHETGLVLCTQRYYDPDLGRWLTRDPIGYDGGLNLYA